MAKKTYTRLFREQFVDTWFLTRDETTFCAHCVRFAVSREQGYEWLRRYDELGKDGFETRSSAPHRRPHATDEDTVELIISARREHPTWGPRKLKAWLEESTPFKLELPAPSTMGDILKRAGLVPTRKRTRRPVPHSLPFKDVCAPNDVWTTDFKGHFRTRDKRLCYPLTLVDSFSRFILRCDAYHSPSSTARASFEAAFVEYGLPSVIRSDNGSPFATAHAPAGLSALSVWWIRLGILPERIAPRSPWENGRHERMHRTLKAEATQPSQANRRQQQRAFDAFRREFNDERPHEALGQKPPRRLYQASKRAYPCTLNELVYPNDYQLRKVSDAGVISCDGHRLFVSNLLRGETVGLSEQDDGRWDVYFGPVLLGTIDVTKREPELRRSR